MQGLCVPDWQQHVRVLLRRFPQFGSISSLSQFMTYLIGHLTTQLFEMIAENTGDTHSISVVNVRRSHSIKSQFTRQTSCDDTLHCI